MDIVILGLSITSSWGNGHATTYRALVGALADRGHRLLFLERDVPWYASQRDLADPPFCTVGLYQDLEDLRRRFASEVTGADLVIQGSYVPEGVAVGDWVTERARGVKAFYDIDTPVTLARLAREDHEYLHPRLIPAFDLYLSFTGGPALERLERDYGSPRARPLYCAVDPEHYYPQPGRRELDLGYMGTYSDDRQPTLERLLLEPARRWPQGRFLVAGPQYPLGIDWPANVERVEHLPPARHRDFYNRQRFTLNITRRDMIRAGFSPSVRLFEAAACACPVISDPWPGLDTFFSLSREILVAETPEHTIGYLQALPEDTRQRIGQAARARVLAEHTAAHRAETLEGYISAIQ
ncbi:MAG: glycosyltransferase, partial [Candidatus Competibacteraceae bacterium]|nr:glycosyltransferase [Candidatus Competibacteraceae bacterium]